MTLRGLLERLGADLTGKTVMVAGVDPAYETVMVPGRPIVDSEPFVLVAHPDEVDTLRAAVELLLQRDPSLDVEVHAHPLVPRGQVYIARPPSEDGTSAAV